MMTKSILMEEFKNRTLSCPDVNAEEVLYQMICEGPRSYGVPMTRHGKRMMIQEYSKFLIEALKVIE